MTTHVWLDLEETIISSWHESLLINHNVIKGWLDDNHIGDINIWSFAIWDEGDRDEFVESGMKASLERVLKRKILTYPSLRDMRRMIYQYEKVTYSHNSDFMSMNGKHWSFIKFCAGEHPDKRCILIDDTVPNWEIKDKKTNGEIILINIADLKKTHMEKINEQETTNKGLNAREYCYQEQD